MRVAGLNHVNVFSGEPEKSIRFYENLGFKVGPRSPLFPDPGTWMYIDGQPLVHINHVEEKRFSTDGTFGHVGFTVHGSVESVTGCLVQLGIEYDLWDPIPGVCRALYFRGPSGEMIEFVMVDNPVPIRQGGFFPK